jgi:IS30 family transposase
MLLNVSLTAYDICSLLKSLRTAAFGVADGEEDEMAKKNLKPNGKHLKEEDRAFIAECLQAGITFKEIGKLLVKDPSTIAKEVKANRVFQSAPSYNNEIVNLCVHRKGCKEAFICPPGDLGPHCCHGCVKCRYCNEICRKFEKEVCPILSKPPYVCNGCARKRVCRLEKYYYKAVTAQRRYGERLRTSRQGVNISEEDWIALDNFVTPLIRRGQPISHIYSIAGDRMPCSKSTLYRYVSSGILSVKNLDLRRVVRYRCRKKKPSPKIHTYRKGRTYLEFKLLLEENPHLHVWEMDTVIGRQGGKVLLTLFSRRTKLMLIFLLESKTANEVWATFDYLEERCGTGIFQSTFQVILTDNGGEFMDANALEQSTFSDNCRTKLFYCDPYSSYQKGGIEKNHEYIRWVLPKGRSFDDLTWYDVALLASHINAIARDSLDGLNPYKASDPSLLRHVDLMQIEPTEVNLTPSLLSQR